MYKILALIFGGVAFAASPGLINDSSISDTAAIKVSKLAALANSSIVFTGTNGKLVAGTLGGDVTNSGSTVTINPGAVNNSKLAAMNDSTIKCNVSGGSASPTDCTMGQAAAAVNSVLGALIGTNNLSDLNNAATARTNLGLGAAATQGTNAFLRPSNSLADLTNSTLSRTNLGFPTIATGSVLFGSGSTLPSVDPNISWDSTNHRLSIGAGLSPSRDLEIKGQPGASGAIGISAGNGNGPTLIQTTTGGGLSLLNNAKSIIGSDTTGDIGLAACPANGQANLDTVCSQNQGSATTKVPFTVYGIASQTGDLFQARTSGNGLLANIAIDGTGSVQKLKVGPAVGAGATLVDGNGTGIYTGSIVPIPPCVAISASNVDWSLGNCFTKTLSANTTLTFSNRGAGQTILLRIRNTGANYTLTFPNTDSAGNSVLWASSTIPTLTTGAKSDIFTVFFDGTEMYGVPTANFGTH